VAEGLRDILTVLNSKRALDETLDYIVDQATKLLGIAAGAIYLQGEDGLLRIRASRGIDPEVIVLKIPVGVLPMGEAAQKGQPVVVSDSNNAVLDLSKAELVLSPYEQAALKSMFLRYPACLAVPLIAKDEIYGAIVLFYYEPQVFSDETIRLTMVFGDQAALAIENARLFAEAEGKAVIEERQRLARDLHDSVSQSLYSLSLLAEAGRRVSDAGDQNSARHYLSRLGETALQSLKDMRLLVYELRPLTLNAEGLAGALQHRLDAVEKRAGMKVSLISNGVINLPATVETELFRVALEALNNTLKHAMATEVVVALRVEYGRVELEVVDNGRGFEPDALSDSGGLGLLSMRERAEKLGGSLMVIASPGKGTRIRIRIGL
jgi:signal transduction histidine kinase